ncbi:MAG: hypothetical protein AAF771_16755 [Pseudomonadota bacterium]
MRRAAPSPLPYLMAFWFMAGCIGLSWDTKVADTPAARLAIVNSIEIGKTTERAVEARWGNPFQKIFEGAQTEFVYRRLNGSDRDFVIITFQHGLATDVRWTETEGCRSEFAPRVPGYGFDTPERVDLIGPCGPTTRPGVPPDGYTPGGGPKG